MTKNITFGLGPAAGYASRTLVITRMIRAGDDSTPAAVHDADAGDVDFVTVAALADNEIYQAVLTDVIGTTGRVVVAQSVQSVQVAV